MDFWNRNKTSCYISISLGNMIGIVLRGFTNVFSIIAWIKERELHIGFNYKIIGND